MTNLNIPEKLFILSIDDERSSIVVSIEMNLRYGLAGAALAELALANKIHLADGRLALTDPTPIGDTLFDDILTMIAAEQKLRKLSHWINVFGRKQTVKQVAERLAEHKVIAIKKKRYLWIIPYEVYPQVDTSAKYWVKQHLRGIVLAGEQAEAADIALLSLLKACRLLRQVFTRDERKAAGKKVDAMVKGEIFGEAVAKLLAEIEAAAAAAAVAASS
jgi:Golgi phosphoprotein 3